MQQLIRDQRCRNEYDQYHYGLERVEVLYVTSLIFHLLRNNPEKQDDHLETS